ncbi:MAG TPA: HAMP domain-containing sensor histidine kinase [Magnetospirillum sp.]|nr:HAMP domain-containing sensor histidine kinase [Magnetospirillum sp.]
MWLSASDFLPHSVCLALEPTVLWLHAISDGVTAISYYSIPAVLLVFARRRAKGHVRWVLMLFAAFVLACGTTHLTGLITLWWPIYVEQGIIKAVTALVSLVTAILLWPLLPHALKAPTREELEREIGERKDAEAKLRLLNAELEMRVRLRTEELEQAKIVAERANEAKTRFLASASHDLRQPFQAMELYREILETRVTRDHDRATLALLGNAMTAGRDLLNALLHISTLEAGITVPRLEDVNLKELLGGIALEFRSQAEHQELRFRHVPCSAVAHTDPVLFGRMVRNLVANALRYTASGEVLVGCRRRNARIRVEVWDTGPGIPEDKQAEIWEEFTQLSNPERDRSKGLGLGLAIVARTGKLLSHPIGVCSMSGKGSMFFIEVPLAGTALPSGAPLGAVAMPPQ